MNISDMTKQAGWRKLLPAIELGALYSLGALALLSKGYFNIAFFSLLVLWLIDRLFINQGRLVSPANVTLLTKAVIVMALACFVSLFHTISIYESLKGLIGKWMKFFLLYIWTIELIDSPRKFKGILWALVSGFTLIVLDGVWQAGAGTDFLRNNPLEQGFVIRGPFTSLNSYGNIVMFLFPIATCFLLASFPKLSRGRVVSLLISILAIFSLFLSFSVESWIALGISLCTAFIIWRHVVPRNIIFVLFLVFGILLIFPVSRSRILELPHQQITGTGGRVTIWKETWHEIMKNPVLGKGVNTTRGYLVKQYCTSPLLREQNHTHNLYLQIWLEMGLIGLLAYLWVCYAVIRVILSLKKDVISLGLFTGILASFLVNMVDNMWDVRIQAVVWIVFGAVMSYGTLTKQGRPVLFSCDKGRL